MKSYFNLAVLSVASLISSHTATAFEIKYPTIRFTLWDDLTSEQRGAASGLGHNEASWNKPGSIDIEWSIWYYGTKEDYYDLDGDENYYEVQPLFTQYASKLGFTGEKAEDIWDCWSTHYNYEWEDIVKYGLKDAVNALGWNQTQWESEGLLAPPSNIKSYNQLTNAEKTAAGVFCYTKSLWDEDTLPYAVDSPRGIVQGKKKKKRSCDFVSADISRCSDNNNLFANHCCNTCGTCNQFKCVDTNAKFHWIKRKKDNKSLFKKCGFLKGKTKKRNCKKFGMKDTCPKKCNPTCSM